MSSWVIILPVVLMVLALIIGLLMSEIIEDEHLFVKIIYGFLAAWLIVAVSLHFLIPKMKGQASFATLFSAVPADASTQ